MVRSYYNIKLACPITNYYFISKFLTDNSIVVVIIFSVVGLCLAFIGMKFFWITLSIILSLIVITLIFLLYLLFANLFGFYGNIWTLIVIIVIGFLVGILISYCLRKFVKIFFIFIGGYLGYIVGIFCFNFFGLSRIESNPLVS